MSALQLVALPLQGLYSVQRRVHRDARGQFARLFDAQALIPWGWPAVQGQARVAQVNHSMTMGAGTVRGLHYQIPPYAEAKLVSCLQGEVWDVALDLRAGSPTFGRWHAQRLSSEEGNALLIPAGFAHGFQVLSEVAQLIYCHSHPYVPQAESGFQVLDAGLSIDWPLPVQGLSARDEGLPAWDVTWEGLAP
jgi:dTDP-4-dehydrorhamnose 3,5-epimerase